ncbi:MAG: hypothetical protein M3Z24_03595, partial [Chloroflexota bacterium]|nr:hypothetical protein [Chloroflexota bacterium]
MSSIKLVLNDLHLADGSTALDCFGKRQQAAFEGLLRAACSGSPLAEASEVELIINGDCFDFLGIEPYDLGGVIDAQTAVSKLGKIIIAHAPFFTALRQFLETPGRSVAFLVGNHDMELCFAEVRQRLLEAISPSASETVYFCPTRFYRPLPDVYIEHGNHYDFWNHRQDGLWDEQGQPLTRNPETITLPLGSHYMQHAAHPLSAAYPYFDHFEPSMNTTRQIALLSLLAPDIVIKTTQLTMELLSEPRPALANLAPDGEHIPSKLFEQAMMDFAAFQMDMTSRKTDWTEPEEQDVSRNMNDIILEFAMMREALTLPEQEAVAAICTPTTYQMGESVATGMHQVLKNDPSLRYAIAGHTHMARIETANNRTQTYLNTASWTMRIALPAPGEVTPELVAWLK